MLRSYAELAKEYCYSLFKWYPTKGGVRSRLMSVDLDSGVFLSSLGLSTLKKAAAISNRDMFSFPLYLVEDNEDQRIAAQRREAAFVSEYLRIHSEPLSRLWACNGHFRWTSGRTTGAGRDELVVLAPLAEDFFGSPYEGWSTSMVASAVQDEGGVESVLMHGTRPHPPGLAVIDAGDGLSNTVPMPDSDQIRIGDQRWIDELVEGLMAIVVDAFDLESLLIWIPNEHFDSSTQSLASKCGMTVIS